MNFVRLEEGDDWGRRYLALPGKRLNARGFYDARECGLRFEEGDMVHVRFPDGTVALAELTMVTSTATVSDHGHANSVTSRLPHVTLESRGIRSKVPLKELEVLEADAQRIAARAP